MKALVIKFPGNPRPVIRHDRIPVVIILPVIRIERYSDEPYDVPSRRPRRRHRLPSVIVR